MSDFNMCDCGALIDDAQGAKCPTCKARQPFNEDGTPKSFTTRLSEIKAASTHRHEFKIGDKVICKSRPALGAATIQSFWGDVAMLMYIDGSREGIGVIYLLPYVDPRDTEIAQLKARLAKIDTAYDECAKLTEQEMPHEHFVALWGVKLEHLFATVAATLPKDHAEITARQNDADEARDEGRGIFY
jgi:hypothetical protein